MRELAREIFAAAVRKRECDFIWDVAGRLPMSVVCQMLGVPKADRPRIERLGNISVGSHDPEFQEIYSPDSTPEMREEMVHRVQHQAHQELAEYLSAAMAQRRQNPENDSIESGRQSDHRWNTAKPGRSSVQLCPDSRRRARYHAQRVFRRCLRSAEPSFRIGRLVADPSQVPAAVEEIVRWTSPSFHNLRRVTRATKLGGQEMHPGELVAVWGGSANRDEEVFPHADQFEISRTPNEHLGFGHAQHFCLGANLARLELRVALRELLPYLPEIELTGPIQRLRHTSIPGIKHMPVRFGRAM